MSFLSGLSSIFGASGSKRSDEPLKLDPCLGDPKAQEIKRSLGQGNWRQAHELLSSVKNWNEREFMIGSFRHWPGRPTWLNEWAEDAGTKNIGLTVRGAHGIHWAWEARGSNVAKETQEKAFEKFFERLRSADADLLQATEMSPDDPTPWAYGLISSRGLQNPLEETRNRFKKLVSLCPDHYYGHSMFLQAVLEKWGGSHQLTFEFVRDVSSKAVEGSGLHTLIAEAHLERWLYFSMEGKPEKCSEYFKQGFVRKEIENAADLSVFSSAFPETKQSALQRNHFALCFYLIGDEDRAYDLFEKIGPQVTDAPWYFLGDSIQAFEKARNACGYT